MHCLARTRSRLRRPRWRSRSIRIGTIGGLAGLLKNRPEQTGKHPFGPFRRGLRRLWVDNFTAAVSATRPFSNFKVGLNRTVMKYLAYRIDVAFQLSFATPLNAGEPIAAVGHKTKLFRRPLLHEHARMALNCPPGCGGNRDPGVIALVIFVPRNMNGLIKVARDGICISHPRFQIGITVGMDLVLCHTLVKTKLPLLPDSEHFGARSIGVGENLPLRSLHGKRANFHIVLRFIHYRMAPKDTAAACAQLTPALMAMMHNQLVRELIGVIAGHHVPGVGKTCGIVSRLRVAGGHTTGDVITVKITTRDFGVGEKVFFVLGTVTHDGFEPAIPIVPKTKLISARIPFLKQAPLMHRPQDVADLMGEGSVITKVAASARL